MNSRTKKRNLRIKDDARSVSPDMTMTDFHCQQINRNRSLSSVEPASEKHRTCLKNELYNFLERKQSTFVADRRHIHILYWKKMSARVEKASEAQSTMLSACIE